MAKKSQLLVDLGQGLTMALGLPSIASWKTGTRPKNAKRGTFGFNQDTRSLEFWDGEEWFRAQMSEK